MDRIAKIDGHDDLQKDLQMKYSIAIVGIHIHFSDLYRPKVPLRFEGNRSCTSTLNFFNQGTYMIVYVYLYIIYCTKLYYMLLGCRVTLCFPIFQIVDIPIKTISQTNFE